MRAIDWEFAASGDPFLDLAQYAMNAQLNDRQKVTLLTEYFGAFRPRDLAHLRLAIVALNTRFALWHFLQAKLSDNPRNYEGNAALLLDEGSRLARSPELAAWLRDAANSD